MKLPARTENTMSDAISMSSPSGRMSKRAKRAASDRLCKSLFGVGESELTLAFLNGGNEATEEEKRILNKERLLRTAKELRDIAARGMSVRKFTREAARLEAEAASL